MGLFFKSKQKEFQSEQLKDGTVKLTKYTGSAAKLEIPSKVDGRKVTQIGALAFRNNTCLTEIIIPSGVTKIDTRAFMDCSAVTVIKLPETLKEIGWMAFEGCGSLRELMIPAGVSTISHAIVPGCRSLTRIIVEPGNRQYCSEDGVLFSLDKSILICCPEGKKGVYQIAGTVKTVANDAFARCVNLEEIQVPLGVEKIEMWAFAYCKSLKKISIPLSVRVIEDHVFLEDEKLTIYCSSGSYMEFYARERGLRFVLD